jgi:isopentenyl diphosphate isomerase/L-lactate dehydrogenase-like FMN-dependent dehydrogenase
VWSFSAPSMIRRSSCARLVVTNSFTPTARLLSQKPRVPAIICQILSTASNDSVEDVTNARGVPIWFQLYASPRWEVSQALIKRAEAAGCPVLVVTVDRIAGRNQETL